MHAALARGGERCCPELVRDLMRELGPEPCQPQPWRRSPTEQNGAAGPIPDLVNRDFSAEKPGQKIVVNLTADPLSGNVRQLTSACACSSSKCGTQVSRSSCEGTSDSGVPRRDSQRL